MKEGVNADLRPYLWYLDRLRRSFSRSIEETGR